MREWAAGVRERQPPTRSDPDPSGSLHEDPVCTAVHRSNKLRAFQFALAFRLGPRKLAASTASPAESATLGPSALHPASPNVGAAMPGRGCSGP
jgi:hypothetical protein